ncbi:MAG: hypothetical protein K6G61_09995 [Solobacterium sp.]|nr:hypothetical protein [Solobacterium sp.]
MKNKSNYLYIGLLGLAVVVFVYFMSKQGNLATQGNGCGVNAYSAFGQAPSGAWVDLTSAYQSETVAKFPFEVPEDLQEKYGEIKYRAYSNAVNEVQYIDAEGNKTLQLDKAYTCDGSEIYELNEKYRAVLTKDINGCEVIEYGDGEKVNVAMWADGDYSYGLICSAGMDTEEAEALIAELK